MYPPDAFEAVPCRLFDKVEKHYGIRIEYTFPDADEVTAYPAGYSVSLRVSCACFVFHHVWSSGEGAGKCQGALLFL